MEKGGTNDLEECMKTLASSEVHALPKFSRKAESK